MSQSRFRVVSNDFPRFFLVLFLFAVPVFAEQAVVFEEKFDTPDALSRWQGEEGKLETIPGQAGLSLTIESRNSSSGATLQTELSADRLAGQIVTIEARAHAERLSKPPQSWNGVKVMLVLETEKGIEYPQIDFPLSPFGFLNGTVSFRALPTVRKATLVLGIERAEGKVWFDDIRVLTGRKGPQQASTPKAFDRGHGLERVRGVMAGPTFREGDLETLAREWGANQIRWQLNWEPMKEAEEWAQDCAAYDKWLDSALTECDKALAAAERLHLKVLVDLHTPPGGRAEGGRCRLFTDARYQETFLKAWDKIAARYKGRSVVYAYDLLNEAVEGVVAPGVKNWRDLATEAVARIRAVDPGKPVVFEPAPWAEAEGFDTLEPLEADKVIYSFHFYRPHAFTHQTLFNNPGGVAYPGVIKGETYNKERLRQEMLPAIEFQKLYHVPIYVGEFSAIRWAPGESAYHYLKDAIELFEEYQWDWSYHAYREFHGWSVEHNGNEADTQPSPSPTARKRLLLDWFGHNKKP
jgi:hypothetical protein